ncbi:uncharacterized protein LOC134823443 [Bolinopsis microptera]|uniref:uncharacterized protein LOC134823443 n=1 Tax=Bolinopsis microptera TaxID=2820187 RepID=UPI00307B0868
MIYSLAVMLIVASLDNVKSVEYFTDLLVTANTFDVIGFLGKAVTMKATVSYPRLIADYITWIKMQGDMPEDGRIQITFDLKTNESSLRINELQYDDAGTYYCTVMMTGVSKSVGITLSVVEEDEIEHGDNNNYSYAVTEKISSILLFGLLFALNMNN